MPRWSKTIRSRVRERGRDRRVEVLDQRKRGLAGPPGQPDDRASRRAGRRRPARLDAERRAAGPCPARGPCGRAGRARSRSRRRAAGSSAGRATLRRAADAARARPERARASEPRGREPARPPEPLRRHQSIPSFCLIRRLTSAPSARPLVSFITAPTIAPGRLRPCRRGSARPRRRSARSRARRCPPARRCRRSAPGPSPRRSRPGRRPTRELGEHLLGGRLRERAALDHPHELGQRRAARASTGGVLEALLAQARDQLAGRPPGERRRRRAPSPSRGSALLEEAAQLRPAHQHRGGLGGEAVVGLVALEPRGRAAREAPSRARSSISSVGASGTRSGSGK